MSKELLDSTILAPGWSIRFHEDEVVAPKKANDAGGVDHSIPEMRNTLQAICAIT